MAGDNLRIRVYGKSAVYVGTTTWEQLSNPESIITVHSVKRVDVGFKVKEVKIDVYHECTTTEEIRSMARAEIRKRKYVCSYEYGQRI